MLLTLDAAENLRVGYVEEQWDRRLAAVFLESIRLIDTLPLREVRPCS